MLNSEGGFAPRPKPPPRNRCAGKAGARTASITAHEVVSERLSMSSLVGAALERMRQHLLHLDDGERGQHPDEAEEQDEEPGEGPDDDRGVGDGRVIGAPRVGVEVVAQAGDDYV